MILVLKNSVGSTLEIAGELPRVQWLLFAGLRVLRIFFWDFHINHIDTGVDKLTQRIENAFFVVQKMGVSAEPTVLLWYTNQTNIQLSNQRTCLIKYIR